MEKRGSRYLRYALYNATKYVCHWNPVFAEYLAKKRAEGKHYNVADVYKRQDPAGAARGGTACLGAALPRRLPDRSADGHYII